MFNISAAGRLVGDPELKVIKEGLSVTTFTVVSNRYDPKGENNQTADFVDVKCWGKRGQAIAEHMSKGDGIVFNGSLNVEKWKDKDSGQNRSKAVIVISDWEFPVVSKSQKGDTKKGNASDSEEVPF